MLLTDVKDLGKKIFDLPQVSYFVLFEPNLSLILIQKKCSYRNTPYKLYKYSIHNELLNLVFISTYGAVF